MKSVKLWQAFALVVAYMTGAALFACAFFKLFTLLNSKWGVPFGIGVGFWVLSLIFFFLSEKGKPFTPVAFGINLLACALLFCAFAVAKERVLSFQVLPVFALILACFYLLLMLFLTPNRLNGNIWYVGTSFVVFLLLAIFGGVWLCQAYCKMFSLALPNEWKTFLVFFYILLTFLTLGSLATTESFSDLLTRTIAPALLATFFIGVIVLLALACGDGGDCDCDCGDCCDCSGGEYGGVRHKKKNSITMSALSK